MTIIGIFLNKEMRTGANRRYLELMEGLAKHGNRVYVLMNTRLQYEPITFVRINIDVAYRRKGFPPASFLFARAIKKSMKEIYHLLGDEAFSDTRWVHIHGDMHLKAARLLQKRFSAKLFFAFRCNDIARAKILRASGQLRRSEYLMSFVHEAINRIRERQVASWSNLVTFQNALDRDEFLLRTGCSAAKTVLIPGNIGLPRFSGEYLNKNTSVRLKRLIYVGNLSVTKGLQYLLEAFAELVKRGHVDLRLTVLGKAQGDEPIYDFVRKLGISDMVSFEGFQLPFPYFVNSDLMVYPTLYDAFPDTILEALHVGCPVIASSVGGIPDLLSHEELLFDASDVPDIVRKIERFITDGGYYRHIRKLCSMRAQAFRFDWVNEFEKNMTNRR